MGTLYIVATPIGNLSDLTPRAIDTLKSVNAILTEDTRVTGKLLTYYEIEKDTLSYHHHSNDSKKLEVLKMLQDGKDLALVTDAGTPGISDPGNELIDFLLEGIPDLKVVPIPGASALTAALSVCGFRADKFIFIGFMPKKKRTKLFAWLAESRMTFTFFESPHRVVKTLTDIKTTFGEETRVCVTRELTKLHETIYRGPIGEVITKLSGGKVKGEVVVVVELK